MYRSGGSVMSDKLSAASLLLAIVAVLYGLWYPILTEGLATPVPEFSANRAGPRKAVRSTRNTRALPLMVATVGVAAVFLPDAVAILIQSLRYGVSQGLGALAAYDSVSTAFVLVEGLSIYFAAHFTRVWMDFGRLLKRLA
jgi:hypothetical protein